MGSFAWVNTERAKFFCPPVYVHISIHSRCGVSSLSVRPSIRSPDATYILTRHTYTLRQSETTLLLLLPQILTSVFDHCRPYLFVISPLKDPPLPSKPIVIETHTPSLLNHNPIISYTLLNNSTYRSEWVYLAVMYDRVLNWLMRPRPCVLGLPISNPNKF